MLHKQDQYQRFGWLHETSNRYFHSWHRRQDLHHKSLKYKRLGWIQWSREYMVIGMIHARMRRQQLAKTSMAWYSVSSYTHALWYNIESPQFFIFSSKGSLECVSPYT
mmetsp:Transcript_20975/g.37496  ORF Transcript_20975/g.37496 Transcript_20975/m.37496 type:complete len:108 (+) Transcript_20975:2176-2499(+)